MDIFNSIRHFLKPNSFNINNKIFRLHYKVTFILLIAFSMLVTANRYIDDPIDCITDEIPSRLMDTYCWSHSTFTVENQINEAADSDFMYPDSLQ